MERKWPVRVLERVELDFGAVITKISLIYNKSSNTKFLTNFDGFLSFVEKSRQCGCSYYDECLSFAARNGWESFSCLSCPYCEKDWPLVFEDVQEEVKKCHELLAKVFKEEYQPQKSFSFV